MDPDANLEEQLLIANNPDEMEISDGLRLAELVMSLHNWIRGGGFLPKAWADSVDPRD